MNRTAHQNSAPFRAATFGFVTSLVPISVNATAQAAARPTAARQASPFMSIAVISKCANGAMGPVSLDSMRRSTMTGFDATQKPPRSGDRVRDFAVKLRENDGQGVDMAHFARPYGKSRKMRPLATQIVEVQTKEMAARDAYLLAHT